MLSIDFFYRFLSLIFMSSSFSSFFLTFFLYAFNLQRERDEAVRANSALNVHALPVPDQSRPYHVKQSSKELTGAYFNKHWIVHCIPVLFFCHLLKRREESIFSVFCKSNLDITIFVFIFVHHISLSFLINFHLSFFFLILFLFLLFFIRIQGI